MEDGPAKFAYVRFLDDDERMIVPVIHIKNFDQNRINFKKKYYIKYTDGKYYAGSLIRVGRDKKELQDQVDTKRQVVVPNHLLCSTTDDETDSENIDPNNKHEKVAKGSKINPVSPDVIALNYEDILSQLDIEGKSSNVQENNIPKKLSKIMASSEVNLGATGKSVHPESEQDTATMLMERLDLIDNNTKKLFTKVEDLEALIIELQTKIVVKFEEWENRFLHMPVPLSNVDIVEENPEVGYRSSDKVHLGRGVWLPVQIYDSACLAGTVSIFIKNIAVAVFGIETLMISSVTGGHCRRTNTPAKPALDKTKLASIHDITSYYLTTRGCADDHIKKSLKSITKILTQKIMDLQPKPVKPRRESRDDEEHPPRDDDLPV